MVTVTKERLAEFLKNGEIKKFNDSRTYPNVDLSEADLSGADLSGANLSGVDLSWTDLRETKGLPEKTRRDWLKFLK